MKKFNFSVCFGVELAALISFFVSICFVCPYFVLTTADIYSHLDVNATGEAGMKLGKLLADDESKVG